MKILARAFRSFASGTDVAVPQKSRKSALRPLDPLDLFQMAPERTTSFLRELMRGVATVYNVKPPAR